MTVDLPEWLLAHAVPGQHWYLKRLSGQDTLACGASRTGPSIPRHFLLAALPWLNRSYAANADFAFNICIDSHGQRRRVRAVWHGSGFRSGIGSGARITRLGGRTSALLDPENTGALALFSFSEADAGGEACCHAWGCRSVSEEDQMENWTGPVEPEQGIDVIRHPDTVSAARQRNCTESAGLNQAKSHRDGPKTFSRVRNLRGSRWN